MIEFLQWIVWLPIWVLFSIVVHELGHALAAKMVGLRVGFCGVGMQRPLISFGVESTRYFFGLWPINGLTLLARDSPRLPTGPMVFAVAAGPLANLLVGFAALGLDWLTPGVQPAWSVLATVSFLLTLNLLPIRSKGTGFSFRTDGMMILQILNGTQRHGLSIGLRLRNHEFLRALGEQVHSPLAQSAHELALAFETLRSLGSREEATTWLHRAVARQNQSAISQQLPEWTRALKERFGDLDFPNSSDVDWAQPTTRPYILVLRAERLAELNQKPEAAQLAKQAIALADRQNCIEAREAAEVVLFEVDPPENADGQLTMMIERSSRNALESISRVRLLSCHCSRLDSGSSEFREAFDLFRETLETEALGIAEPEAREKFLKRWLAPVAESALGEADAWRLLAPTIPLEHEKPRPNWLGQISLWLWVLALALTWSNGQSSLEDLTAHRTAILILLASSFGLFLGGIGLASGGNRAAKLRFWER